MGLADLGRRSQWISQAISLETSPASVDFLLCLATLYVRHCEVEFFSEVTMLWSASRLTYIAVVEQAAKYQLRPHSPVTSKYTCLFPASSLSTSNPPDPILLLRDFFTACFPCAPKLAIAAVSIVIFSLSPPRSVVGMWAIDLRAWRIRGTLGLCVDAIFTNCEQLLRFSNE